MVRQSLLGAVVWSYWMAFWLLVPVVASVVVAAVIYYRRILLESWAWRVHAAQQPAPSEKPDQQRLPRGLRPTDPARRPRAA